MKKLLLAITLTLGLSPVIFAGDGDNILRATLMVDKFEYQLSDAKTLDWSTYAYVGYDLNKIYLYSEGTKEDGASSAESENRVVYSRAILPYWDIQLGAGYDENEDSDQTWGVIGVQGLAPYFFETRTTLFIGDDGNIGLKAEAEYEALLTQKLILTPSLNFSAHTKDNEKMGIGSGLSNITLGARLRYEFVREFAPYIGFEWSKNFGKTNTYTPSNEIYATVGLRFWL